MKGVKCIKSQKLSIILALLFVPLFILLNTSKVYAASTPFSVYWRSFYSTTTGFVNQSDAISGTNTSAKIVAYNTLNNITLLGVSMDFAVDDNTEYKYKQMVVKSELYQPISSGNTSFVVPMPSRLSMNTTSGSKTSTNCGIVKGTDISGNINNQKAVVTCSIVWDDYGTTSNAQLVLGTIQNASQLTQMIASADTQYNADIYISAVEYNLSGSNDPSLLQLQEISNAIVSMNSRDSQDRTDLQNTSDGAESDASSAASDINNAKTSLLTVIGNFINVVIHPPSSNCVIDADMGNMDLGDIDLCQLSLPPAFAVIGSLLIIGFIIPFAYSLIMTVLSLLKGATDN